MKIIDINGNERDCVKAYPDPSYPGFVKADFKNKRRSYSEWYPVGDFMNKNPGFFPKSYDVVSDAPDTIGVTTSSTNITLTDKKQHWQSDSYRGFPVWISRGKGEGQVRHVLSNTKDTLSIDKKWEVNPDKFSQYVLSHNIHEHMPAVGNVLPEELQEKYERRAKEMDREVKKAEALAAGLKSGNN